MTDGAKAWIVRGAGFYEGEEFSFANHRVINHWGITGDLADCTGPIDVNDLFGKAIEGAPGRERFAVVHQLWTFRSAIRVGDVIATPRVTQDGTVAIGVCCGTYRHVVKEQEGWQYHRLPVAWINTAARIPTLRPDLARLIGEPQSSFNLVLELTASDAAARLLQLASAGTDSGPQD